MVQIQALATLVIEVVEMVMKKWAPFGAVFVFALGIVSVVFAAPGEHSTFTGPVTEQNPYAQSVALTVRAKYRRPDRVPFPDHNPYSEAKALLGKTLFFDPRLSKSNIMSCRPSPQAKPGL